MGGEGKDNEMKKEIRNGRAKLWSDDLLRERLAGVYGNGWWKRHLERYLSVS